MRRRVLIDTGPLVASLDRRDSFHRWITTELSTIAPPLLTCEEVISEACFLLQNVYPGANAVISLINTGIVRISVIMPESEQS